MDNLKTVVIYCNKFSMGGTEMLIIRLLRYYRSKSLRTILLTLAPIESMVVINDLNECDFEHYVYDKEKSDFYDTTKKLNFIKGEKPLVITQYYPEFFHCFSLLHYKKYKVNFRQTIFIVHPFSTYVPQRKLFSLAKKVTKILLERNILVFMDEVCVAHCVDFYNLDTEKFIFPIYRLPVFIRPKTSFGKSSDDTFNILTISRYDFPFKGYVLGLIKTFSELYLQNNQMRLRVIGYGAGKDEIDQLLSTLTPKTLSAIDILDQVPNSEIDAFINECDVYVGMGTTVLDAANSNKIVITAAAYQRENFAVGYFHEKFQSIGELYKPKLHLKTFDELINNLVLASNEEFIQMCDRSKQVLDENYNIEKIAADLLMHNDSVLNFYEVYIIRLLAKLHSFSDWLFKKIGQWT